MPRGRNPPTKPPKPVAVVDGTQGAESLDEEVRQALLSVLRDHAASAAAKASAGRTLMEFFGGKAGKTAASLEQMSEGDIDAEISRLKAEA
jgi:hypothetical protein